eukprot:5765268-Prymnesium_polylepis.1
MTAGCDEMALASAPHVVTSSDSTIDCTAATETTAPCVVNDLAVVVPMAARSLAAVVSTRAYASLIELDSSVWTSRVTVALVS